MSFRRYEQYKDSGVEWLGEVPEHWDLKRLILLASINNEVLSEDTSPEFEMEYLDISSVTPGSNRLEAEPVKFGDAPSRARRRVKNGDVLVSTVRTYLRAIAPIIDPSDNLIASTGFAVVRPRHDCSSIFLNYALQASSFIEEVIARSTGVSYPAINAHELGFIKLPIPQLKQEQERIGRFIEAETTKLDALIGEQRRLIELLKEKRQAVISHAVTKGLDPKAATKGTRIEWLASVPSDWKIIAVKELAMPGRRTFIDGDWVELPFITEDGIRLIQTGNVGIGFYKDQGFRYISEKSFGELGCTEIFPNDVLICRLDGPVGRACMVPDLGVRMITSVDNTILKVREDIDPRFVVYLMSSALWLNWNEVLCRVGGGFRVRVSRKMLGDFRVPCPPYSEQVEIADMLDQALNTIDNLLAKTKSAIDLLNERRSALISAAVTGKIDVRNYTPKEAA
jgi:type I restriction enzyme S subunit